MLNIEDSKCVLIDAISDLSFSEGGAVQTAPCLTAEIMKEFPEFSDICKIITWVDGRYVILHCNSVNEGKFTSHLSVHSVINHIPDAVVLAWVNG
tara:strand:+ start:650 stop:934 length:285 start_codon:yes stop_codon:yes gene_type:complete